MFPYFFLSGRFLFLHFNWSPFAIHTSTVIITHTHSLSHTHTLTQNHNEEGEAGVKAKLAKLSEDMQEQFRKLEE